MLSLIPEFSGSLSFLGRAVGWIINLGIIMGSVGLGIIIFTLLIKLVTMPFEIYSRVSMKKSSLAMEKVKPQLEKLKAQYKNDEQTYRQKSMEIYKKNGFSPFKACLPILITLPLFFIIFSGFNNYSAWANINNYSEMATSYNQSIKDLANTNTPSKITYSGEQITSSNNPNANGWVYKQISEQGDSSSNLLIIRRTVEVYTTAGPQQTNETEIQKFFETGELNGVKLSFLMDNVDRNYNINSTTSPFQYKLELVAQKDNISNAITNNPAVQAAAEKVGNNFNDDQKRAEAIIEQVGKDAAEAKYREINKKTRFLWVGNIWNSDVSYVHPIHFDTLYNAGINFGAPNKEAAREIFNKFTGNLNYERDKQPNGFFIIIFLSAGALFVSQYFISRQSKTQNDIMQGNGKAAKIMKWIPLILIPGMYIWFGFTYSMAYMLYLFLSSTISFVSNLIVNAIIEKKFMKDEAKELQNQYNKRIPTANKK